MAFRFNPCNPCCGCQWCDPSLASSGFLLTLPYLFTLNGSPFSDAGELSNKSFLCNKKSSVNGPQGAICFWDADPLSLCNGFFLAVIPRVVLRKPTADAVNNYVFQAFLTIGEADYFGASTLLGGLNDGAYKGAIFSQSAIALTGSGLVDCQGGFNLTAIPGGGAAVPEYFLSGETGQPTSAVASIEGQM